MKNQKLIFGLVFLGICVPFSLFATTAGNTVKDHTKIILNWKAEPEFGGFYEAQRSDLFKQQGLDVEIIEGGSGTPAIQMVASGKADFGIAAADEVVISRERGTDVVALFAVYQTNPQGIMAHAEKNFKNMKELLESTGTLAIQKGAAFTLHLIAKYPTMKMKMVPYLGGIGNFLNDSNMAQQCYVTAEPLAAEKAGKKVKSYLFADEGFNPYGTVLITRELILKQKPELVQKMLKAVRLGWGNYMKEPEATNALMQKLNPSMDAETFGAISKVQKTFIETAETRKTALGKMTLERWQTLINQLATMKLIQKQPKAKDCFR